MQSTYVPQTDESQEVADFLGKVSQAKSLAGSKLVFQGKECEIPSALTEVFAKLLTEVALGNPVTVVAHEKKLTTQQAADHLGISRPTLIKFLDRYAIPIETIGKHRRIKFADVERLRELIKDDRSKALIELIRMTEELGLYEPERKQANLIKN